MNPAPNPSAGRHSPGTDNEWMLEAEFRWASQLYRALRRKDRFIYALLFGIAAAFAVSFFVFPHVLSKAGAGLMVLGAGYVGWRYRRCESARPPGKADIRSIRIHVRDELVRQRDASLGYLRWQWLPFVPGEVLFVVGATPGRPGMIAMAAVGFAVWSAWAWKDSQRDARDMQKRIDVAEEAIEHGYYEV